MNEEQSKLVHQAQKGNQEALTELYQQARDMAFFTAMRYVKDEDDAADVVQDAFITAFRRLDIFDEQGNFTPWMRKIVANQALHFLRAKDVILADEDLLEELADEEGLIPAHYLEQKEKRDAVMQIIQLLPDGQRIAVTLHYFEGMAAEEIAEIMGIKLGTAKSHLYFGRKAIRAAIQAEEGKENPGCDYLPVPVLAQIFEIEAEHAQMPREISRTIFQNIARELPALRETSSVSGWVGRFASARLSVKIGVVAAILAAVTSSVILILGAHAPL